MTLTLGPVDTHFWLTRGMSRTLGISLTEAMAGNLLDEDGYCAMVTRCRTSACAGRCVNWMAKQGAGATAAPEFCANAVVFNRLRASLKPSEPVAAGAIGR